MAEEHGMTFEAALIPSGSRAESVSLDLLQCEGLTEWEGLQLVAL